MIATQLLPKTAIRGRIRSTRDQIGMSRRIGKAADGANNSKEALPITPWLGFVSWDCMLFDGAVVAIQLASRRVRPVKSLA